MSEQQTATSITERAVGRGAPQVVFPVGDNRIAVPNPTPNPYTSIGWIVSTFPLGSFGQPVQNGPPRASGTGTVCDDAGRYIVTAAHNFIALDESQDPPVVRRMESASYQPPGGGAPILISDVQLVYATEYMASVVPLLAVLNMGDEVTSFCYDLAVAKLATPVQATQFVYGGAVPNQLNWTQPWPVVQAVGPLPALPIGPPWSPQVTGYPGDKPAGTMWTAGGLAVNGVQPIRLIASPRLLFYQIATAAGQSGGPIWGATAGANFPVQIGVHLGAGRDQHGAMATNIGLALDPVRVRDVMNAIAALGG